MTATIGNPLSWGARLLGRAGSTVGTAAHGLAGETRADPVVNAIGMDDIRAALRAGVADFAALRTDVAAMCLLYPVIGAVMVYAALHQNLMPLVFPMISGFALVGPAVAVGLYEMSRRRERGEATGWMDGFAVLASPSLAGVIALSLFLFGVFAVWVSIAWAIHAATLGPTMPGSVSAFVSDVLTTRAGWTMAILGTGVGFVFAAVVLAVAAFSFPLMIDRPVGLPRAVITSLRVARRNPVTVAAWGLIVAALLVAGSLPLLLGLAVVMPVLGHATWHLYRRAVS